MEVEGRAGAGRPPGIERTQGREEARSSHRARGPRCEGEARRMSLGISQQLSGARERFVDAKRPLAQSHPPAAGKAPAKARGASLLSALVPTALRQRKTRKFTSRPASGPLPKARRSFTGTPYKTSVVHHLGFGVRECRVATHLFSFSFL